MFEKAIVMISIPKKIADPMDVDGSVRNKKNLRLSVRC